MKSEPTPQELLENHCATGEPLDEAEVKLVIEAGISTWTDWENRGGGLYWHVPTFSEIED